MKSCALSDLPAAPALPQAAGPTPPPTDKLAPDAFGALLQVATDQAQPAEEPEDKPLPTLPLVEKKKDDPDPTAIVPLICFCPLPDIKPVVTAPNEGLVAIPAPAEDPKETRALPPQPIVAQTPPPIAPEKPLEKIVQPKPAKDEPKSKTKEKGALALPRELFEPVELPERAVISAKPTRSKSPDSQPQAVTNAPHGTLVAKLDSRVKNNEKTAEIAAPNEQKMPVRPTFRRAVAETARVEDFLAGKDSGHVLQADFQAESTPEIVPVKSLDAAHLVESIRTEVAHLHQRGDVSMSVVLKPDTGTQLTLDVSISRDGTIQAQARCERGDFQNLHAQWPQLQQSLAVHGIQMADLSGQNNSSSQHQNSPNAFLNFDRGQNPQQRNQREPVAFEEQLAGATPRFNSAAQKQTPVTATPSRRWQSWA